MKRLPTPALETGATSQHLTGLLFNTEETGMSLTAKWSVQLQTNPGTQLKPPFIGMITFETNALAD
jgi:hypothetical protein